MQKKKVQSEAQETFMENKHFRVESEFQNYVMKRLKEYKYLKFYKASDRLLKGVSDLILCYRGRFVAIELKVGNNKPTPHQQDFIAKIKYAGGVAGVARTWGEVKGILSEVEANTYSYDAIEES